MRTMRAGSSPARALTPAPGSHLNPASC